MTDTSASSESGSVLRPFEQRPMEPLPPVEPSKVVPVDRMPRVPDSITPEDVTEADNEPPVENEVGILEELEESFEQIEGAADGDETTAAASDQASDGFWGPAGRDDDGDDDGFDIDVLLGPRPDQGVAERSELEETDDVLAEAGEGHGPTPDGDEGEVAAADPAGRDAGRTVELPRKPFLVASGIIGVLLVVLVALWQTSEGGSGDEATGARMVHILLQFMTEALVVCSVGGLVGVAGGLAVAWIAKALGTPVVFSLGPVLLAFGSAFFIGLLFGFLPARRAAQLDPVVALASE